MVLSLILWGLFLGSFSGMIFIVSKKFPQVMLLSEESLPFNSESFGGFLKRNISAFPHKMGEGWIEFLKQLTKILLGLKSAFLKLYNIMHSWTERLNQKLHQKKQAGDKDNTINS